MNKIKLRHRIIAVFLSCILAFSVVISVSFRSEAIGETELEGLQESIKEENGEENLDEESGEEEQELEKGTGLTDNNIEYSPSVSDDLEQEQKAFNNVQIEGEYGSPENGLAYDFTGIVPIKEDPEIFDRYAIDPLQSIISPMMVTDSTQLSANISKRAEWIDPENGNGQITLQYSSNSGSVEGTEDMNVILIQDKSGSMDVNYGFKIQLEYENLSINDVDEPCDYYPIRNSQGYSENASELVADSNYVNALNYTGDGFQNGYLYNGETMYNSPCQMAEHYYLMVKADANSGYGDEIIGTFVHGNNLYNISCTDLHHYVRLSNRIEAMSYIAAGRRVVRTTHSYRNADGIEEKENETEYFLDISQIYKFNGKKYLSVADTECEQNDRLSISIDFMKTLVSKIQTLNSNNKIAYIPFWGDVPESGSWQNLSSNGSTTNIYTDTYQPQITYKNGVSYINFTESNKFNSLILPQIQNPFTYNGTNWTRAFNKVIDLLNARCEDDKKKETLIVFLTDGVPQGFAGQSTDVINKKINGEDQIKEIQSTDGVTVYACGVCLNIQDKTIGDRLNPIDSSGTATAIRYLKDFDKLINTISQKIDNDYKEVIQGTDTFYTDILSDNFVLDIEKLDNSWKILGSLGSGMTKGVPTNVYNAVVNSSTVNKIYVKSTNTVYWYIGTMTDGSYTAAGHSITFPIKFNYYNDSTAGQDRILAANTEQKLTYVSTANTDKLLTVTTNVPDLVFYRDDEPTIKVTKKIEGSTLPSDQSFEIFVSPQKIELTDDPKVNYKNIPSEACSGVITIKKGGTNGSVIIKLNESFWQQTTNDVAYIYEAAGSEILSGGEVKVTKGAGSEDGSIVGGYTAAISTLLQSSGAPASATASDRTLQNQNNYLKISSLNTEATITNYYTEVGGKKIWEDGQGINRPSEITVNLLQNGKQIYSKTVKASDGWEFLFSGLEKYDSAGNAYKYTVSETPIENYEADIKYNNSYYDGSKYINYVTITNKLLVANLTVIKNIDADADNIWWEHGNPTFIVKVEGTGIDGKNYTFYHTFEFTEDYVESHQSDGKVSMEYTFFNIPISERYNVMEIKSSRYNLKNATVNDSNSQVIYDESAIYYGYGTYYVQCNLAAKPQGTVITLFNEKDNYSWFSHTAHVENKITW